MASYRIPRPPAGPSVFRRPPSPDHRLPVNGLCMRAAFVDSILRFVPFKLPDCLRGPFRILFVIKLPDHFLKTLVREEREVENFAC